MSDIPEVSKDEKEETITEKDKLKNIMVKKDSEPEILEKEFIPHFLPTYRVSSKLYALPIIIVVFFAGLLAYLTYVVAGVQVEGGYVSEEEFGITAGLINGIIFVSVAAVSSFLIPPIKSAL